MTTAVVVASTFEEQRAISSALVESGLFALKSWQQAYALGQFCAAEGLPFVIGVRDYDVVNGKPTMKSKAKLARFQAAGGRVRYIERGDSRVVAEFSHPQGGTVTVDWDVERAKKAGLFGKATWQGYTRQMLTARVISEGIDAVFPGAGSGLMTPEEASDIPAESAQPERDVTPAKPATGVAALQERVAALAPTPKVEPQPEVVVDTTTGELLPPADAMSFAEVAEAINRASDKDSIVLARDLIRGVADEQQRAELDVMVRERANAIRAARKREAAEAGARG